MNPEARKAIQLARLRNLAEKVYRAVPFYRKRFDEKGVKAADIVSLQDIGKLPFTTKDDLRDTYPYGLLAVPHEEIKEIHMSSGTTGIPVVDAYTQRDLDDWAEGMARTLNAAGADRNAVVQNAYGYGLFTGGAGVHFGAALLGATVIPVSSGNTQKQLMLMRDFGTTLFTCTPSYALYMAEQAKDMGIDPKSLGVCAGCFGAEPWSENMRREIEKNWGIKAYDIYGLTEITGPGVAFECEYQEGLHVNEDMWYPEIIDPETGKVLPDGEKGEGEIVQELQKGFKLGDKVIRYAMVKVVNCD